jgi:hypothetical protein
MEAAASFEALAARLSGQPISYVWQGHGSAIFMEFGELTPMTRRDGSPSPPRGEVTLGVEWSWRIEDDTEILCGSWSEEAIWEENLDRLRGARVERLTLFGRLSEVELATESGVRFLSFSTRDGQPE